MKCEFVVPVDIDVSVLDDAHKSMVKWRKSQSRATGKPKMEPYFPAGTVYDHPNAFHFVDVGCAIPADDECADAARAMTPEQRKKLEQNYRADAAGIHDAHDRELFFAGVIAGYEDIGNGQHAYKPGPNYAAWKEAQDAEATDEI